MGEIMVECYYFGCWDRVGHFLFAADGRRIHCFAGVGILPCGLPKDFPVRAETLDGGLLGYEEQVEGRTVVTHIRGWTILSFWDRSVDERPGCNSNFVMRGNLSFADALDAARTTFPKVIRRFAFPIVEWNEISKVE